MQEFQSFLWLILGITVVFVIFRLAKAILKWVLLILFIGVLLYYYQPTRHWLEQVLLNRFK
jgi:predicted membrane protein